MKIKLQFILLFAFLFVWQANAQLFWKVSGNGLEKPSYLFGTHHLIESEQIPDFQKVLTYVKEVDVVLNEIDMSNMMSISIKMAQAAIMKDKTLKDLLAPEDYALVETEFKETVGMGLDKLGRMKPAMLSALYTVSLYKKHQNLKKEPEAVDIIIQKAGKKAKKEIVGLETVEQQIEILFDLLPVEKQAEELLKAVKDKENAIDNVLKLNEAYLAGNLQILEEMFNEIDTMDETLKEELVNKRNNNWMLKLTQIFEKKSGFVAVGCLHLVGEAGLIEQFRKLGYTVEPVKF